MAELIWQAADPAAAGHVATYNSGGARVEVHVEPLRPFGAPPLAGEAKTPPPIQGTSPDRGGIPGWVPVGLSLMEKRIREYLDETGRLPSKELLDTFQREMGRRLDAYIEEPMKHPFRPMGLRAFEVERREKE